MKNITVKVVLVLVFTLCISLVWQRFFYQYPSLSEQQSIKLIDFFGAENSEEIADLELYFVLFISFVFSLFMVLVGSVGIKMLTKQSR